MFGVHFQNIFSPYALTDHVINAMNACYMVIPHKAYSGDQVRLDSGFLKEEYFVALSSIKNGKS
jgi:hypothetical protein